MSTKTLSLNQSFELPLEFASSTSAIFGIRGAGKTNTASVIVEELLDLNMPVVIIDLTDAWWGLRSKYAVFIFGGSHGDLPIQETDGKVVAQFVVSDRVPVILSLRHLRKNAQRRFVTEFCEELYHLKGAAENRTALTVVIDESPLFIPQRVMGEVARTVGAVEDLIARGRSSGFGVVLISQRPATINKDVLTQADTIITHRITSPQDRKALSEWFSDNAANADPEILNSLSTQKPGQAWVWAPIWGTMKQIQVRARRTFDSSATPKVGEVLTAPKKLAEVNIDLLKGKMAHALEAAKQNDPALLRTRIRELEHELKTKPAVKIEADPVIKYVDRPILESGSEKEIRDCAADMRGFAGRIEIRLEDAIRLLGKFSLPVAIPKRLVPKMEMPAHAPTTGYRHSLLNGGEGLTKVDRAFLTVLANRQDRPTARNQLAVIAGYSSKSGHVDNTLGALRARSYVEGDRENLSITTQGRLALGDFKPLPTGPDLIAHWVRECGAAGGKMLQALVDCYPATMERDELARATGYSPESGHVDNTIGHLRTLELVTGPRVALKASDTLMDSSA